MQDGLDLIQHDNIEMRFSNIFILSIILLITLVYYSRVIDGFENIPASTPIPRFTKTPPIIPKKPPPSTNSNGGLVHIS